MRGILLMPALHCRLHRAPPVTLSCQSCAPAPSSGPCASVYNTVLVPLCEFRQRIAQRDVWHQGSFALQISWPVVAGWRWGPWPSELQLCDHHISTNSNHAAHPGEPDSILAGVPCTGCMHTMHSFQALVNNRCVHGKPGYHSQLPRPRITGCV